MSNQTDIYLGNPNLKRANVAQDFTKEEVEEFIKCSKDPVYFIKKYIQIISLDKGLVPFTLYDFQEKMVNRFNDNRFNIAKLPRQSGKSTAKGAQANMAALQRSLMALDGELSGRNRQAAIQLAELQADTSLELAGVGLNIERIENTIANAEETARTNQEVMRQNMKSTIAQTERNLRQIALDRQFADINTREGMMLFPERLSYDPAPELTPERVFVDRMEAIPGFVPPPVTESRFGGFLNTLGSIASIATPFIKP